MKESLWNEIRTKPMVIRFSQSEWTGIRVEALRRHEYASAYCRRLVLEEMDRLRAADGVAHGEGERT